MFNMPDKVKRLQAALQLSDDDMASYLGTNVSNLREAKAGSEDLPQHAAGDVLDTLGFVKLTDALMYLMSRRAREKLVAMRSARALTIAQKKRLKQLLKELHGEHQKD